MTSNQLLGYTTIAFELRMPVCSYREESLRHALSKLSELLYLSALFSSPNRGLRRNAYWRYEDILLEHDGQYTDFAMTRPQLYSNAVCVLVQSLSRMVYRFETREANNCCNLFKFVSGPHLDTWLPEHANSSDSYERRQLFVASEMCSFRLRG